MKPNKKNTIILILKVLEEYSDEDHYLTQAEIISLLKKDFDVTVERKSVSFSISLLIDLDFDIVKSPKGGYALIKRIFNTDEILMISDAIFSSKRINNKTAISYSNRLNSLLSVNKRRKLNHLYKNNSVPFIDENHLYKNIKVINFAIKHQKKVIFRYYEFTKTGDKEYRNNGYTYSCSPYFVINNFGNYYLLCNLDGYKSPVTLFKVEYIDDLKESDIEMKPFSSLKMSKGFDLNKYLDNQLYLLSGNPIKMTLEIDNTKVIPILFETFLNNLKLIKPDDGKLQATITVNETKALEFLLSHFKQVTLIEPKSLKIKFLDRIKKLTSKYPLREEMSEKEDTN